jgi:hypothetical protein
LPLLAAALPADSATPFSGARALDYTAKMVSFGALHHLDFATAGLALA